MVVCSACGFDRERSEYSSNQLRRNAQQRRCSRCVDRGMQTVYDNDDDDYHEEEEEEETYRCAACHRYRRESRFSRNQLSRYPDSPRCARCIERDRPVRYDDDDDDDSENWGDDSDEESDDWVDDDEGEEEEEEEEDDMFVSTFHCVACNRNRTSRHFSKNQLSKRSDRRRCTDCVDNGVRAGGGRSNNEPGHVTAAVDNHAASVLSLSPAPPAPAAAAAAASSSSPQSPFSPSSSSGVVLTRFVTNINKDEFLCGVCMEVMEHREQPNNSSSSKGEESRLAKILPCLHLFCAGCLKSVARMAAQQQSPSGGSSLPKCPCCREEFRQDKILDLPPVFKNMIDFVGTRCRWYPSATAAQQGEIKATASATSQLVDAYFQEHEEIVTNTHRTHFYDETADFAAQVKRAVEQIEATVKRSDTDQIRERIKRHEEELADLQKELHEAEEQQQQLQSLQEVLRPIHAACAKQPSLVKMVDELNKKREEEASKKSKKPSTALTPGRYSGVVQHVNVSRLRGGITLDTNGGTVGFRSRTESAMRRFRVGDRVFCSVVPHPRREGEFRAEHVERHRGDDDDDHQHFDPFAPFTAGGAISDEELMYSLMMQLGQQGGPLDGLMAALGGAGAGGGPQQQQQQRAPAPPPPPPPQDDEVYEFRMPASAAEVD